MVEIEILTAPLCHGCETAKRIVLKLIEEAKSGGLEVSLKITDIVEEPEKVVKYGILSTPGIVIDGVLQFTKVPKIQELRERLGLANGGF